MTTYQKEQNDLFFKGIIQVSKFYLYPMIGEYYKIENGKMYPQTERGRVELINITTSEFRKEYIG